MSEKLTVKQQKFADEYIVSGNATQSAIKAGYSEKTARSMAAENLAKPYIKSYIDERLEQLSDQKIADQEEVLTYLTNVMRGKETEAVATAKGIFEGVEVGAKDRLKAAELIGKRYSLWKDSVNISSSDINIKIGGDEDGD